MENLFQLVYTSKRKPDCSDAEIDKILGACKKNNPQQNITGVLLYTDKMFVQYLEGDSRKILALYDSIKKDDRHERSVLISYGPLNERAFPNWHMGAKTLSEDDVDFHTEITHEDKKLLDAVLRGEKQEGLSALNLLKKFFEN